MVMKKPRSSVAILLRALVSLLLAFSVTVSFTVGCARRTAETDPGADSEFSPGNSAAEDGDSGITDSAGTDSTDTEGSETPEKSDPEKPNGSLPAADSPLAGNFSGWGIDVFNGIVAYTVAIDVDGSLLPNSRFSFRSFTDADASLNVPLSGAAENREAATLQATANGAEVILRLQNGTLYATDSVCGMCVALSERQTYTADEFIAELIGSFIGEDTVNEEKLFYFFEFYNDDGMPFGALGVTDTSDDVRTSMDIAYIYEGTIQLTDTEENMYALYYDETSDTLRFVQASPYWNLNAVLERS